MAEIKAHLNYFRITPRKVRLVTNLVKGLSANEAIKQLRFSKKRAAPHLLKLLKSAIANAKNNFRLNPDDLYIKEFKVDEAPMLKRYMPRARGRASMIRKRRSHITIVLAEQSKSKISAKGGSASGGKNQKS